jgi:hypothetical protein
LDGVIEIASRDSYPIFGSLDLGLQIAKIVISLELRISFADSKQAAKSTAKRVLSLFEFAEFLRVGWGLGGINRDFCSIRPGIHNGCQRRFFEICSALDYAHQVWYQVRATLVLCLNLGPGGIDGCRRLHKAIVAGCYRTPKNSESQDDYAQASATYYKRSVHDLKVYPAMPFPGFQGWQIVAKTGCLGKPKLVQRKFASSIDGPRNPGYYLARVRKKHFLE